MSSSTGNNNNKNDRTKQVSSSSFLNLASEVLSVKNNLNKTVKTGHIFKTAKPKQAITQTPSKDAKSHDDEEWEKSRVALEKKAQLYDKLKGGVVSGQQVGVEEVLFEPSYQEPSKPVDFVAKLLEREIVDEFGRTRKVSIFEKIDSTISNDVDEQRSFSEVRTRGVGFYSFSSSSDTRKCQLAELRKKRIETLNLRDSHQSMAERRREYRARRLEIALERKKRLTGS